MLPNKVDISLDSLLENGDMHPTVYNLCMRNGLTTLGALTRYYEEYKTFMGIPLCGAKKERQIIALLDEYRNKSAETHPSPEISPHADREGLFGNVLEMLNGISLAKEPMLQYHFEKLKQQLSPHTQTMLTWLLRNAGSVHKLLRVIFRYDFRFETVATATSKAAKELEKFRRGIYDVIFSLWVISDDVVSQPQPQPAPKPASETVPGKDVGNEPHLALRSVKHFYGEALDLLRQFSPAKKAMAVDFFTRGCSKLTIRSSNVLTRMIQSYGSINRVLEIIFQNDYTFKVQRNAGEKTTYELDSFRLNMHDEIIRLNELSNEKVNSIQSVVPILTSSLLPHDPEYISTKLTDPEGKIMLFKLMDLLTRQESLFKEMDRAVFMSLFQLNGLSQGQLADQFSRSRERIRQLSVSLKEDLATQFDFLHSLEMKEIQTYDLDVFKDGRIIAIDEKAVTHINSKEDAPFNTDFYAKVFKLLLRRTHIGICTDSLAGGKMDEKDPDKAPRHYLIERSLTEAFNFATWLEDIHEKLNGKIKETYTLYFDGYLRIFYTPGHDTSIPAIRDVCEYLLFNEFDTTISPDGYLTLEKNTRKLGHEYMYEILEEAGRLMDIDEIVEAANLKYPGLGITARTIKPGNNYKDLFLFIGRSGRYGLKHWESEQPNIRGGTIRHLVEECLNALDEPGHIDAIMEYVGKYRTTTEINVVGNLKLDTAGRFIFFQGGYIGLTGKQYDTMNPAFRRMFRKRKIQLKRKDHHK